MPSHHFPAPSSVEEYSEYFLVRDYNGQELVPSRDWLELNVA